MSSESLSISEIKKRIENTTQRSISYQTMEGDAQAEEIGERVKKGLRKIQQKWAQHGYTFENRIINLTQYSVFSPKLNKPTQPRVPSWQVFLWEPFVDKAGDFSFDRFRNAQVDILKARQIGFSYATAFLTVALGLGVEKSYTILGAKSKDWIKQIFVEPYYDMILPVMSWNMNAKYEMLKAYELEKSVFQYNAVTQSYVFPAKSRLQLIGIDTMSDKNRGKGNVNLILVDEAAYVENSRILNAVLQPMLNFAQGGRMYASTPAGDNWFKGSYVAVKERMKKDPEHYRALMFDLYNASVYTEGECDQIIQNSFDGHRADNPTLSTQEIILLIAEEYFCHFNQMGKKTPLYAAFVDRPHRYMIPVNSSLRYNDFEEFETYVVIDYGGASDPVAVLFVAVNKKGQLIVFDEVYQDHVGIREITSLVKNKEIYWGIRPRGYYIDRSTGSRAVMLSKNEFVKIQDLFHKEGLMVALVPPMRIQGRLDIANEYLIESDQYTHVLTGKSPAPRLFITDACINLKTEMLTLKVEKVYSGLVRKTKEQQKMDNYRLRNLSNNHASDALLYAISTLSGQYHRGKMTVSVGSSEARRVYQNTTARSSYTYNAYKFSKPQNVSYQHKGYNRNQG